MPQITQQGVGHASNSKRSLDIFEPNDQFPPLKRSKLDQTSATVTFKESTVYHDACPTPAITDFFYHDLIPKAPELSQLFPTICHDAHVVRRWLGPVGCAAYWRMVMEEVNQTTTASDPSQHLVGFIAHSLRNRYAPSKEASGPKFRVLCETLGLHLRAESVDRIVIFSESWRLGFPLDAYSV